MLNLLNDDITNEEKELLEKNIDLNVDKAAIEINPCIISHLERLETEDEVRRRKEEEERLRREEEERMRLEAERLEREAEELR